MDIKRFNAINGLVDFAMTYGEATLSGTLTCYKLRVNDPSTAITNNLIREFSNMEGLKKEDIACGLVTSFTDKNETRAVRFDLLTEQGFKLHKTAEERYVDVTVIVLAK